MMDYCFIAGRALLLTLAALSVSTAHAAQALKTYNVDPDQISVSGLSSGGYMAVQMHVAFSASVMGAGVLAAGPYFCAEGNVLYATTRCLNSGVSLLPPGEYFQDLTEELSDAGRIDSTAGMAGDRVWLFTGGADDVVATPVVDRLRAFYESFVDAGNIVYLRNQIPDAQHAMITDDYGKPCGFEGGAYINDCDFDAAGALLKHIYGELKPPVEAPPAHLKTFDQSPFSGTDSLGAEGFVYVPSDCESGDAGCRLHVAFHGCRQNRNVIGDEYARHAGYNEWAEANDVVVLYPQTESTAVNQCWDWWGYTDGGVEWNYATRSGLQMAAVRAMIGRVAGEPRSGYCGADSIAAHVAAGRAYSQVYWWLWDFYYASGSNDYLGWLESARVTLKQVKPGAFEVASACP
ncbi:MAG: PHA-depolymerase-like protein [Gammaproteobacteria bacterium]|nr:PHA-depolymerase-like protein [Gammaproteobacteria bacterium]